VWCCVVVLQAILACENAMVCNSLPLHSLTHSPELRRPGVSKKGSEVLRRSREPANGWDLRPVTWEVGLSAPSEGPSKLSSGFGFAL
jgi:hypothetical protein